MAVILVMTVLIDVLWRGRDQQRTLVSTVVTLTPGTPTVIVAVFPGLMPRQLQADEISAAAYAPSDTARGVARGSSACQISLRLP